MLPERGSVRLTLDPDLQRTAERLLAGAAPHEGGIVAADPRTGRILAWATRGSGGDYVAKPFAPSASLFKLVTATALLDGGKVNVGTRQCWAGGEHSIREADLREPRGGGTRCTSFGQALGHSVNVVFARLATQHLAADDLREQAYRLGFAGELPIDLAARAGEVAIPDDRLGMAQAAAGFWNGRLSPLGALFAMQTIANDGERVRLRVVGDADVIRETAGRAMEPQTARALRHMLEVTTRSGTAAKVFHERPSRVLSATRVAGKTGTLVGDSPRRMFSWFAGFAPANEPRIVVAVMLANDLKWRAKANQVARDLLEAWLTAHKN